MPCLPFYSHVLVKFFPTPFIQWRCHINFWLRSCYRWERNHPLKIWSSCIIQGKNKVPVPVQGVKHWSSCSHDHAVSTVRRTRSSSPCSAGPICGQVVAVMQEKGHSLCDITCLKQWGNVHLPEGSTYCVSHHRTWKLLQSCGCGGAHVCGSGCASSAA